MLRFTILMMGVCILTLGTASVMAETTTTEVQSPDGTTTTVIAPATTAPQATPPAGQIVAPAVTGTTVVVDPPVAIDAITGKPVSNTTAPKKKEESLRDRVRDKMENK